MEEQAKEQPHMTQKKAVLVQEPEPEEPFVPECYDMFPAEMRAETKRQGLIRWLCPGLYDNYRPGLNTNYSLFHLHSKLEEQKRAEELKFRAEEQKR